MVKFIEDISPLGTFCLFSRSRLDSRPQSGRVKCLNNFSCTVYHFYYVASRRMSPVDQSSNKQMMMMKLGRDDLVSYNYEGSVRLILNPGGDVVVDMSCSCS